MQRVVVCALGGEFERVLFFFATWLLLLGGSLNKTIWSLTFYKW